MNRNPKGAQANSNERAPKVTSDALRLIIESAPQSVAMFDRDMRYLLASRKWLADYRISESEIIGKSHYEIFPEVSDAWREYHRRALAGDVIGKEEDRFERLDGTVQWIRWEIRPWFTDEQKIGGILMFTEDITSRKNMEEALKTSELDFRDTFASAPVGIAHVAFDGHWLRVNEALCHMLGYSEAELMTKTFADLTHPDDIGLSLEYSRRLSRGEIESYSIEKRYIRRDASEVWVNLTVSLKRDLEGRPLYFIDCITDITRLKRIEEALLLSEARFRQLAEFIPQMVWTATADGTVDYLNQSWFTYTGLTADQSLGAGWVSVVEPEDARRCMGPWLHSLATGEPYEVECRYRRANDGQYRWHLTRAVAIRDPRGGVQKWLGSCTDIHDHKQMIENLERSEERLREAVKRANEANELKSAFLANMSHEIRTPLGAILGFTDLLQDPSLTPMERQNYHAIVRKNGEQLSGLINDILDLSKVEAGQFRAEIMRLNVRKVVEEVIALLSAKAREKGIDLHCDVSPGAPEEIGSDPMRLRQILTNVLGNAIKFTDRGYVSVLVANDGERGVHFLVQDTGIGMTEEQAKGLFQPFYQVDPSVTRTYGGTGLGLVLSKKLAKALGGDISLRSTEPGKGSVFEVKLPDQSDRMQGAWSTERKPSMPVTVLENDVLKGLKILLVEDAVDNQQLIKRMLGKRGAEVEVADNGQVGVEMAMQGEYDLILMDMQMPVMDGYTATETLRERGFRKPIVALTAHAMNEVRSKTMSIGCVDFLTKPVRAEVLVAKVAEHAGRVASVKDPRRPS